MIRRRHTTYQLMAGQTAFQRDIVFFLIAYAVAIGTGCVRIAWVHQTAPWILVGLYGVFVIRAFQDPHQSDDSTNLHPLYLQADAAIPRLIWVILQLLLSLGCIVGGAQLLTHGVVSLAKSFRIPPFVLSAILIPLTTELPETLNSVVWIRKNKDGLALGNITGAMVFQSTLVPALGIWLTPWNLTPEALVTGGLTLAAAAYLFGMFRLWGRLVPAIFLSASTLYWILPLQAVSSLWHHPAVYWLGSFLIALLFLGSLRYGARFRHV